MLVLSFRTRHILLRLAFGLLLVAALGACVDQPPLTATPSAGPTAPAVTVPPRTPEPTVPPFEARDIRIDIDAGDYQVKGMPPNRTVQLPLAGSPYGVIIHYPFPIRPYSIYPAITDPRNVSGDIEIVQPPDANSLAFIVTSGGLGFFNVAVQVGDSRPVRLQIMVEGEGTPIPPPPTPAPTSLRAAHQDVAFHPFMLPAQKTYAQVSMS